MKSVLGAIMMAFGILIAGISGLCSLTMFIEELGSPQSIATDSVMLVLVFGGIPFLVGVALMVGGWFLLKTRERN